MNSLKFSKRRTLQLVACVCLGALTTVAVAWAAYVRASKLWEKEEAARMALQARTGKFTWINITPTQWPVQVPSNWPAVPQFGHEKGLAYAAVLEFSRPVTDVLSSQDPRNQVDIVCSVIVMRAGWPLAALECASTRLDVRSAFGAVPPHLIETHIGSMDVPRPLLAYIHVDRVPIWIRPGPFALNTAFYTATFATLWITPLSLTRLIRRRKGRCPSCNYDRTGLAATAPCPECGTTPTPR